MTGTERYEWDERKRQRVLEQRGIDFAIVERFEWETALTAPDDRRDYGERRFLSLGLIDGRLHAIAWCYRGERTRVISLRKANDREKTRYERFQD